MIRKFEGVVEVVDSNPVTVLVGGTDVLYEIAYLPWSRPVTVALADERFIGDLSADPGASGYSEWTPGSPSRLVVGMHDVLYRLVDLAGQRVTLWFADEPINTLE